MRAETLLSETLAELRRENRLRDASDNLVREQVRRAAERLGQEVLDASSNDYLGLGGRDVSRETVARAGAGASRLIHGTAAEHVVLEAALAEWVGSERALLFSSTYAANLGLVAALGVPGSLIVSDATNHASLIDGARLAKAEVRVIPHLDLDALRAVLAGARGARACWVVTESYFSMDGDGPDLVALRALCDEFDAALIVDEAHALGVFGPSGAGLCAEVGIRADVVVGALGKAVGSQGGFVAGTAELRSFLWNRARSFVFSTALSPAHTAVTSDQVQRTRLAEDARARLAQNSTELRAHLASARLPMTAGSFGPIVSIVLGSNERVLDAAARLRERGILAQAIRPPTVPEGGARLRVTVKATFSDADVSRLAKETVAACRA